jgi:hypothetical protein
MASGGQGLKEHAKNEKLKKHLSAFRYLPSVLPEMSLPIGIHATMTTVWHIPMMDLVDWPLIILMTWKIRGGDLPPDLMTWNIRGGDLLLDLVTRKIAGGDCRAQILRSDQNIDRPIA